MAAKTFSGYSYLIRNGASTGDYPVPEVVNLYSILLRYIENTPDDGPEIHGRLILVKEYMACLDAIQLEAQSINFYPFLSWANITAHILSDVNTAMIACSEERAVGADELSMKFFLGMPKLSQWGKQVRRCTCNSISTILHPPYPQELRILATFQVCLFFCRLPPWWCSLRCNIRSMGYAGLGSD
jgi:hypothetical protein